MENFSFSCFFNEPNRNQISEKVENMSIPGDVVEQVKKYLVQDVWGSETEDAKPELVSDCQ